MEIRFERARPEDAHILTGIALAAKRHWDYPERWIRIWMPILTVSPELIASADIWSAYVEGQAVAFYAVTFSGRRAALEHFWVLPKYMGQGVGRRLFEHALGRCRGHDCTVLEIESDPHAQGFYERMGARKTGERRNEVGGVPRILPVLEIEL
jgi:GNAT superfamily N-acetyltransferase